MDRASGILLPISALPSPYGIGTLGKAAYAFADFLHAAGQRYWQLLPLGPTSYGDSPYQSFSTFAGNPYFIDLDLLAEEGLLDKEDLAAADWGNDPRYVDYGKIYEVRFDVLRRAFLRGRERDREAVERFQAENPWLKNYALYMAVKAHFGMKSWLEWPDEAIRVRAPEAVARYEKELAEDVAFYTYLQYLFFKQWGELREYIHSLGIRIIGDLPIYVAMDSADVWAEPEFFQLGEGNIPTEVSGVPPDYFSADGQLWGNPLYDYDRMRQDGFGWWIRRVEGASRLFDVIRIDHFRGLESYWAVPYGAETAREGRWRKGPGMDLVGVLTQWFHGLDIIAEDLGFLTPSVFQMVEESGFPGMKVLEFAFSADGESIYLPYHYQENCIVYTGTHDNDTLQGWYGSMPSWEREFSKRYLGNGHTPREEIHWDFIRAALGSRARLAVIPMQDYLGLGSEARMNEPSTLGNNWKWRLLPGQFDRALREKCRDLAWVYGRGREKKEEEKEK